MSAVKKVVTEVSLATPLVPWAHSYWYEVRGFADVSLGIVRVKVKRPWWQVWGKPVPIEVQIGQGFVGTESTRVTWTVLVRRRTVLVSRLNIDLHGRITIRATSNVPGLRLTLAVTTFE